MLVLRIAFQLFLTFFSDTSNSYLVVREKMITVSGNTSIGGFDCTYETKKSDTLFFLSGMLHSYEINIPTDVFQCGNFFLNKDFQRTIKARSYPEIEVLIKNINHSGNGSIQGNLQLLLVGKTKDMGSITFKKHKQSDGDVLTTTIPLQVSEFDIDPPKKLGGLIKTDDIMYIKVELFVN